MKTIKARSNKSKKTFTIRKYDGGKCYLKFRTSKLTTREFEEMDYYTISDWDFFLRSNGSYYCVK